MLVEIVGVAIVVLVYLCLLLLLFAPSLYAVWIYIIGRKVKIRRPGLLRNTVTACLVNAVIAYFVAHLAYNYFLETQVAQKDALAVKTVEKAVDSQKRFFAAHGRYYAVGPVRGPYSDENGLTVEKDLILQVVPSWDKTRGGRETFEAYALHVWGKSVAQSKGGGEITNAPMDSEESARMRAKLMNSTK